MNRDENRCLRVGVFIGSVFPTLSRAILKNSISAPITT